MLKETTPQVTINVNASHNPSVNAIDTNNLHYRLKPPSAFDTLNEITAPLDWVSVAFRFPALLSLPKGDGRPIVLVPGYMSDEKSMCPLGEFLKYLGYQVFSWKHGTNNGFIENDTKMLAQRVEQLRVSRRLGPITLIGWSLGGVLAREVARLFPSDVHQVITLGTPITGGPKYTAGAASYAKKHRLDLDKYEAYVNTCNRLGLTQPVSSIFSKRDGIVSWAASIDTYNEQARNIEVSSTHYGLGINSKVWEVIAHELGEYPLIRAE